MPQKRPRVRASDSSMPATMARIQRELIVACLIEQGATPQQAEECVQRYFREGPQ